MFSQKCRRRLLMLCAIVFLPGQAFSDNTLQCERVFPESIRVEALQHCNQPVAGMDNDLNAKGKDFDLALATRVLKYNNIGGSIFTISPKVKKTIYRSANLAQSPRCLDELVNQRKVTTIINLYSGTYANAQILNALEQNEFQTVGGDSYVLINNFMVDTDQMALSELNQRIASIIKLMVNTPDNVLIHCLVGENDTGVIFGVLQKCYNKRPLQEISNNASCHMGRYSTAYESKAYQNALKIIDQYPCDLLKS